MHPLNHIHESDNPLVQPYRNLVVEGMRTQVTLGKQVSKQLRMYKTVTSSPIRTSKSTVSTLPSVNNEQ